MKYLQWTQTGQVEYPTVHEDNSSSKQLNIISNYEGWNFNSGNYLFTTDTK